MKARIVESLGTYRLYKKIKSHKKREHDTKLWVPVKFTVWVPFYEYFCFCSEATVQLDIFHALCVIKIEHLPSFDLSGEDCLSLYIHSYLIKLYIIPP